MDIESPETHSLDPLKQLEAFSKEIQDIQNEAQNHEKKIREEYEKNDHELTEVNEKQSELNRFIQGLTRLLGAFLDETQQISDIRTALQELLLDTKLHMNPPLKEDPLVVTISLIEHYARLWNAHNLLSDLLTLKRDFAGFISHEEVIRNADPKKIPADVQESIKPQIDPLLKNAYCTLLKNALEYCKELQTHGEHFAQNVRDTLKVLDKKLPPKVSTEFLPPKLLNEVIRIYGTQNIEEFLQKHTSFHPDKLLASQISVEANYLGKHILAIVGPEANSETLQEAFHYVIHLMSIHFEKGETTKPPLYLENGEKKQSYEHLKDEEKQQLIDLVVIHDIARLLYCIFKYPKSNLGIYNKMIEPLLNLNKQYYKDLVAKMPSELSEYVYYPYHGATRGDTDIHNTAKIQRIGRLVYLKSSSKELEIDDEAHLLTTIPKEQLLDIYEKVIVLRDIYGTKLYNKTDFLGTVNTFFKNLFYDKYPDYIEVIYRGDDVYITAKDPEERKSRLRESETYIHDVFEQSELIEENSENKKSDHEVLSIIQDDYGILKPSPHPKAVEVVARNIRNRAAEIAIELRETKVLLQENMTKNQRLQDQVTHLQSKLKTDTLNELISSFAQKLGNLDTILKRGYRSLLRRNLTLTPSQEDAALTIINELIEALPKR